MRNARTLCTVVALGGLSGLLCSCVGRGGTDDVAVRTLIVSQLDFTISVIGVCGALVAFIIGLRQYKRSEQWKRAEFTANEMKDLFGNPRVGVALTLIDWGARHVNLQAIRDPENKALTYVTRRMQCIALLPHTVLDEARGSDIEAEGQGNKCFSSDQAIIRDCFDALLDGLERFGSFLESTLVSAEELRPYIGYWIDDIARPTDDADDAAWTACLLMYIHTYGYKGVQTLFDGFKHDIRIDGRLYSEFLNGTSDQRLKSLLESARVKAS